MRRIQIVRRLHLVQARDGAAELGNLGIGAERVGWRLGGGHQLGLHLVELVDEGDEAAGGIAPLRPETGWTLPSPSLARWTGSVTVPPHAAEDFLLSIQANATATSAPISALVIDTDNNNYLNTAASTSQGGASLARSSALNATSSW